MKEQIMLPERCNTQFCSTSDFSRLVVALHKVWPLSRSTTPIRRLQPRGYGRKCKFLLLCRLSLAFQVAARNAKLSFLVNPPAQDEDFKRIMQKPGYTV